MSIGFPDAKQDKQSSAKGHAFYLTAKSCLMIALYALFTVLFYRQAVEYNGGYASDLPAHIQFSVNGGNYSFLYFIMGFICRLPVGNIAVAFFGSSMVVFTFLMTEKCIRRRFEMDEFCAMWISAGLLFLCSIYIPRFYQYYYKWSLITQPWHNITYFGMRLFSVPVFFYALDMIERYRARFTWKDWMILVIPLLLSALIKPNFLAGYSMALLCVLIADFVRDILNRELSAASFFRYVSLGSSVLPAVAVLFYQMYILYNDQSGAASDSGMEVVFWTSQFFALGMIPAIMGVIRDIAFPLLVTAYGYRHVSRKDKFVWLLFVITLIQRIILQESGPRAAHQNLTWGIYNAGYLLFLYMIPKFIQMVRLVPWGEKKLQDKCFMLAGGGLLCAHLLFGLKYFFIVFSGEWFYI